MRYFFVFGLLIFTYAVICQEAMPENYGQQVNFTFSKACKGEIYISCFQIEENFMKAEKATFSEVLTCQDTLLIEGLNPDLPIAILGYIDLNGNAELDLNFFGVPTEPYAISNGFRGKWREPKFEDAAFPISNSSVQFDFKYWKER